MDEGEKEEHTKEQGRANSGESRDLHSIQYFNGNECLGSVISVDDLHQHGYGRRGFRWYTRDDSRARIQAQASGQSSPDDAVLRYSLEARNGRWSR